MRVKVKDINSNPFRDLSNYPMDERKIEVLKISINKTGFWSNILIRRDPDDSTKYQLAYGHHRLRAITELEIEEIDVPVKDLSDITMLRIMADENFEFDGRDMRVINQTVESAKSFIEDHIKSKDIDYHKLDDWCRDLFNEEQGFNVAMGKGLSQEGQPLSIGRSVIQTFLGSNWKKTTIDLALKALEGSTSKDAPLPEKKIKVNTTISREALEKLGDVGKARAFAETISRDPNCRAAYPTEEIQTKVVTELLNENKELTPSILTNKLKEKAKEKIDTAVEINPSDTLFLDEMSGRIGNKSKKLLSEITKIHRRVKELPDFRTERVLTRLMVQSLVNDLYTMEYTIKNHREELENYFNIVPDKGCIAYSIYPTCTDFAVTKIPEILDFDKGEIEGIDYHTTLDEDEMLWVNSWIADRKKEASEDDQ